MREPGRVLLALLDYLQIGWEGVWGGGGRRGGGGGWFCYPTPRRQQTYSNCLIYNGDKEVSGVVRPNGVCSVWQRQRQKGGVPDPRPTPENDHASALVLFSSMYGVAPSLTFRVRSSLESLCRGGGGFGLRSTGRRGFGD